MTLTSAAARFVHRTAMARNARERPRSPHRTIARRPLTQNRHAVVNAMWRHRSRGRLDSDAPVQGVRRSEGGFAPTANAHLFPRMEIDA